MGSVPTSLGEWIHSPWLTWDSWCGKGTAPGCAWCLRRGHASAWISPFWRGPAPEALDTPFTSQDKPPLAIAMVVTLNGVRSLRR